MSDDKNLNEIIKEASNKKQVVSQVPNKEYRIFGESMSDDIGMLAAALAKAQGACTNGPKDKQGYGYTYLQLPTLIDIIRKPLADNDIAIIQTHELIKGESPSVVTHTTIIHKSNQWHKSSFELPIKVMDHLSAAQMAGVSATYGRRYALQAIMLVGADEDTDGNEK